MRSDTNKEMGLEPVGADLLGVVEAASDLTSLLVTEV